MSLLKFKPFKGSHSEEFRDPDTDFIFQDVSRKDLKARIIAYREQNQLDNIELLDVAIEDYQCRLPHNAGKCTVYEPKEFKRGWMTYVHGGLNLLKMVMFGKYVDQATANKRAEQCAGCPLNSYPADIQGNRIEESKFDRFIDGTAYHMVDGDRNTPFDDRLKKCAGCGCILKAAVWATHPFNLDKEQIAKMKPFNCWKLRKDAD